MFRQVYRKKRLCPWNSIKHSITLQAIERRTFRIAGLPILEFGDKRKAEPKHFLTAHRAGLPEISCRLR
jgi:hypothetical protein